MAANAARAKAKRHGPAPWLQGLACGIFATLLTPTAALAGTLLAPALVVYMLDSGEGRALSRTVVLAGLAAAAQPMVLLWSGGHSMPLAMSLLTDPGRIGVAWAAQGIAWLLAVSLPLVITTVLNLQSIARSARLRAERSELEQEWGLPPAPKSAALIDASPAGEGQK